MPKGGGGLMMMDGSHDHLLAQHLRLVQHLRVVGRAVPWVDMMIRGVTQVSLVLHSLQNHSQLLNRPPEDEGDTQDHPVMPHCGVGGKIGKVKRMTHECKRGGDGMRQQYMEIILQIYNGNLRRILRGLPSKQ